MMSSAPETPDNKAEAFAYDHLGNRYQYTGKDSFITTYSHNSVNQYDQAVKDLPWVEDEVKTFIYDDNGNLENDGYSYVYDYRNRLIEVQDPNSSNTIAEYTFDALGRRISKTVDSETTYYFYDLQGRVIAEYEGSTPELAREYVFGNGINEVLAMFTPYHAGDPDDWDDFLDFISTWLSEPGDGNWDNSFDVVDDDIINFKDIAYFASVWDIPSSQESDWYYLTDALGSVRGLVGGRFQRESDREFYNYDVYGNLSIQSGEESKSGNPYLFAGYRFDTETDLYQTKFRTYDAGTGRWLQLDPIGYAGGLNMYEYSYSSPAMYIDPFGLLPWWMYQGILDPWGNKVYDPRTSPITNNGLGPISNNPDNTNRNESGFQLVSDPLADPAIKQALNMADNIDCVLPQYDTSLNTYHNIDGKQRQYNKYDRYFIGSVTWWISKNGINSNEMNTDECICKIAKILKAMAWDESKVGYFSGFSKNGKWIDTEDVMQVGNPADRRPSEKMQDMNRRFGTNLKGTPWELTNENITGPQSIFYGAGWFFNKLIKNNPSSGCLCSDETLKRAIRDYNGNSNASYQGRPHYENYGDSIWKLYRGGEYVDPWHGQGPYRIFENPTVVSDKI